MTNHRVFSTGEQSHVLTALLPLRLFTSIDVCKHAALLSLAERQVSPLLYRPTVLYLLSFLYKKETKVTDKGTGVSYANWSQISAQRKQQEVTEHSWVPRIFLTHT